MKHLILSILSILISINLNAQTGKVLLNFARQGDVEAMYAVALRYNNGFDGLPKDKTKALYWAEKAAELGNVDAMILASSVSNDRMENLMASKQIYWGEKAAQAGSTKGMTSLCRNYSSIYYSLSDNKPDQIKCCERLIYWYGQLSQNYDLSDAERESAAGLKRNHERNLAQLKGETALSAPETVIKEKPVEIIAPQFPGGQAALRQFIARNLNKSLGNRFNTHGVVVVSFTVNSNGSLSMIENTHLHSNLDTEARRVVKMMPNWIPGTKNGQPAPMKQKVSIEF